MVRELTQTLYTVADDAYLNIQFNSNFVKEYRLIGYDNKLKALADTLSEVEGGEVGSGHSLMILFELTPPYGKLENYNYKETFAKLMLHYRIPADSTSRMSFYDVSNRVIPFNDLPYCYQFATSVTMFAALLKESKYSKHFSWNDAIILAHQARNSKDPLQVEFIEMIEKAKKYM